MRQLLVAVNGGTPVLREVQSRTNELRPGTLCEIWFDDHFRLCLIDRVISDLELAVRFLPEPASPTTARPPAKREI